MKNLAIITVMLGLLSGAANAESAVNESNAFVLASNNGPVSKWLDRSPAANNLTNLKVEREVADAIQQMTKALDKQLANKITKEIEYAMQ